MNRVHTRQMRLISWNVNGRVRCIDEQIKALGSRGPDIVALQEIRENTAPIFADALYRLGLRYSTDSFQCAVDKKSLTGPRRYGELIACCWPIQTLPPTNFDVPWPERILSVIIRTPIGSIELHTTHIPPGVTNGLIKIETLEGIFNGLARYTNNVRILCGDFNTPKDETSDGQVVTWGKEGTRWDKAERSILCDLAKYDLQDVFRSRHGYAIQEFSWYARPHIGRRFDHVFASMSRLDQVECRYIHAFRENRLSDHSAIEVDFAMRP